MEFKEEFKEEFKALFTDGKHKNYCAMAPPSGRVRSSHSHFPTLLVRNSPETAVMFSVRISELCLYLSLSDYNDTYCIRSN